MPKKRIDHKGKPKHSTEKSEDYPFKKNSDENSEDEYTTVVDYETNKKYSKRLIENNWAKYESSLSDLKLGNEEDDLPKTNDFNYLIKTASSDCSHFEFNSEKLWKSEQSSVPASKIFNLDIDVLSKALACVPFYEMMGLSENELTDEDKKRFDEAAKNARKEYDSIREKALKSEEPTAKDLESVLPTLEIETGSDKTENEQLKQSVDVPVEKVENVTCENKGGSRKMFFGENEENLEDWLDSVLDD